MGNGLAISGLDLVGMRAVETAGRPIARAVMIGQRQCYDRAREIFFRQQTQISGDRQEGDYLLLHRTRTAGSR